MIEASVIIMMCSASMVLGICFEKYMDYKIEATLNKRIKRYKELREIDRIYPPAIVKETNYYDEPDYTKDPYRSDEPSDPGETGSDEYPSERYQHNDVRRDYLADSMVRNVGSG